MCPGFEKLICHVLVHKSSSILFYSYVTFSINLRTRNSLCNAWNNAFRRVYNLLKFASTRHLILENNRTVCP